MEIECGTLLPVALLLTRTVIRSPVCLGLLKPEYMELTSDVTPTPSPNLPNYFTKKTLRKKTKQKKPRGSC